MITFFVFVVVFFSVVLGFCIGFIVARISSRSTLDMEELADALEYSHKHNNFLYNRINSLKDDLVFSRRCLLLARIRNAKKPAQAGTI